MCYARAWLFLLLAGTCGAVPLEESARASFQPCIDRREVAGIAVAVVRGDDTRYFFFGLSDVASAKPVTAETIFEIGSITKTFTGTLLALAVQDGAVKLDTPVQKLLPEAVHVPKWHEQEITLLDLAAHRSGLPRMPGNWAPADERTPYVDYTAPMLYDFLERHTLRRAPGEAYEYSNVATALLGHALALKAGRDYEALVRERILSPLGMATAHIRSSPAQLALLAQGYASEAAAESRKLAERDRWDFDVFAPAGALRANITDMAKYLRANIAPDETPLGRAMRFAQEPRYTANPRLAIGLGWHLLTQTASGQPVTWHNGQTGGYHSMLAFDAARKEGVVLLSNTNFDSDKIVLDFLAGLASVAGG